MEPNSRCISYQNVLGTRPPLRGKRTLLYPNTSLMVKYKLKMKTISTCDFMYWLRTFGKHFNTSKTLWAEQSDHYCYRFIPFFPWDGRTSPAQLTKRRRSPWSARWRCSSQTRPRGNWRQWWSPPGLTGSTARWEHGQVLRCVNIHSEHKC